MLQHLRGCATSVSTQQRCYAPKLAVGWQAIVTHITLLAGAMRACLSNGSNDTHRQHALVSALAT